MAWLILIASGVLEAVWATALSRSEVFPGSARRWFSLWRWHFR